MPASRHEHEVAIRRSRFLAIVAPATTPGEAQELVLACRHAHPKANHHCWAYVCGPPGSSQVGMSDDGEPSGTAGAPMLQILSHAGIGDVAAVVVRYFGGVKLGTGGLVRAYSGVLQEALASLPVRQHITWSELAIRLSYADEPLVRRLLPACAAELLAAEYAADVVLRVRVPEPRKATLGESLVAQSNGRVEVDG